LTKKKQLQISPTALIQFKDGKTGVVQCYRNVGATTLRTFILGYSS